MAWIKLRTEYLNTDNIVRVEDVSDGVRVHFTVTAGNKDGSRYADFKTYKGDDAERLVNALRALADRADR